MPLRHYVYGEPITADEYKALMTNCAPKMARRHRKPKPEAIIAYMHNVNPVRLAHEVDRIRGTAFDSGEAGFSHSVVQ